MANYGIKPRWQKGQSGNLKGRPKSKETNALISRIIQEENSNGVSNLEAMIRKVVDDCIRKGDVKNLRFILDRVNGKPKEEVNLRFNSLPDLSKINWEKLASSNEEM